MTCPDCGCQAPLTEETAAGYHEPVSNPDPRKEASRMSEREQAIEQLREIFPPGSTVYTVRRHRSRSGASHSISVITQDWQGDGIADVSYHAAKAMDDKIDRTYDGIKCHGGGMDIGFDLVYSLSSQLYPDGFECIGERCPSNDHTNGDRNYSPHHHASGGYALKHRWL